MFVYDARVDCKSGSCLEIRRVSGVGVWGGRCGVVVWAGVGWGGEVCEVSVWVGV
jgi:hypothetical protein